MPSGKLQVFHRKKTALVFFICAAALALLAAGCTLHMRLRNRFIDQL